MNGGVSYHLPLLRAWQRSVSILFRPFEIEKWLVLGFTVFLAGLVGGLGGLNPGIQVRGPWVLRLSELDWNPDWLSGFGLLLLGIPLLTIGLLLVLALLWVSSRGKFLFLHAALSGRPAVAGPWSRFKRLGDSLFFWRVGFALVCVLLAGLLFAPFLAFTASIFGPGRSSFTPLGWFAAGVLGLPLAIATSYIWLFLEHFVVPIMYRYDLPAGEAWSRFLVLFRTYWLELVIYGLVVLLLLAGFAVVMAALAVISCCFVPALLMLPYVSSVLLLPVVLPFRLYGVEFLAQFDPEPSLPDAVSP